MADVAFPVVLVDGDVLDPSVINAMVTSTVAGQGLLSEMNGHLEAANFDASFTVQPVHIKPGAVFRGTQSGAVNTMDWTGYLFPPADGEDEDTLIPDVEKWAGIAGTGAHIYLPQDYSAVMYRVSIYVTAFRMREYLDASNIGTPQIFLQMHIDDDVIQSTTVKLPETYRFNDSAVKDYLTNYESLNTRHFDFSYLSIAIADTYNTKGWHRMSLRARIVPNGGEESLAPPYKTTGTHITYDVDQRLRIGIRNARVLGFK